MTALSSMVKIGTPHVSLLTKMDLLSRATRKRITRYLDPDTDYILEEMSSGSLTPFNKKYMKLTKAVAELLNDYSLISFVPLNLNEEDSIANALITIDNALQFGENEEVKTRDFEEPDDV